MSVLQRVGTESTNIPDDAMREQGMYNTLGDDGDRVEIDMQPLEDESEVSLMDDEDARPADAVERSQGGFGREADSGYAGSPVKDVEKNSRIDQHENGDRLTAEQEGSGDHNDQKITERESENQLESTVSGPNPNSTMTDNHNGTHGTGEIAKKEPKPQVDISGFLPQRRPRGMSVTSGSSHTGSPTVSLASPLPLTSTVTSPLSITSPVSVMDRATEKPMVAEPVDINATTNRNESVKTFKNSITPPIASPIPLSYDAPIHLGTPNTPRPDPNTPADFPFPTYRASRGHTYSTTTPPRPVLSSFLRPRRPSSAPAPNGGVSLTRRSSGEMSALSEHGEYVPHVTPYGVHRKVSTASIDSVGSNNSTGTPRGEEDFYVMRRLEEEKDRSRHDGESVKSESDFKSESEEGDGGRKDKDMKKGLSFSAYLQASFNAVRESVIGGASATTPTAEEEETDWEFWGRIISSPSTILKHPRLFTRHLHSGIPPPLRGTIWLLLSKGKDPSLEQVYATLLTRTSIHEKVIQRDLARTFPGVERFKEPGGAGQESLFNVVRAYTMYDTEVGYCQGVAFVVGVLLLNMPDEEAFCVLVRLMKDYKLRDFYTPQMVGLQLRLYQYDELLEEMFPNVARHLEQQEVRSTMYASQWFLTLFAYRFPLPVVYRILDILFFEGLDVLLRISLTLIKRNLAHILTLDFEPLLDFLQNGLFEVYSANPSQLIIDAMAMKISKTRLKHLEDRFEERRELEGEEYMKERELRIEMRRMRESVKRMETEYEMLNREHVQLANRVLEITVSAERDQETARVLKERVKELEENRLFERQRAEESVQVETDRLAMKNLELTRQNVELEEEKAGLESEVEVLRRRLDESEREKKELMVKLEGVRRAFG